MRIFCQTLKPGKYLLLIVGYILNVYAPTLFEVKKNCNIVNGSRNLFNLLQRGRDYFAEDKTSRDIFMNTILNNSYFLLQEHLTLGFLSDTRLPIRKLGKQLIIRARKQQQEIEGVRQFTKIAKIEHCNEFTTDYACFLDVRKMPLVTEPTPTMDLTIQQLDSIVAGHESVVDLCGLQDTPCHTQVIRMT